MHTFLRIAVISLAACLLGAPALAATEDDTVDLDHLIAAYHQAVVDRDGKRLEALFLPDGTAWFSVLTDAALAKARARDPNAPKVHPGSVKSFVELASTTKDRFDPTHSNLRIQSDGAIATVTFDFRFLVNGTAQNSGSESWQLVKGAEGWRIASIVYSSTPAQR